MIHFKNIRTLQTFSFIAVSLGMISSAQAKTFSIPQHVMTVVSYENGKWSAHASQNPKANLVLEAEIESKLIVPSLLTHTPVHECIREAKTGPDTMGCIEYSPSISGYQMGMSEPFHGLRAKGRILVNGTPQTSFTKIRNEQIQLLPNEMGATSKTKFPTSFVTQFSNHGDQLAGTNMSHAFLFNGRNVAFDITVKCPSYTEILWEKVKDGYQASTAMIPSSSGLYPSNSYVPVSACMVEWRLNDFSVSQVLPTAN